MSDDDFYEDDEPIENIIEAWQSGEHGITAGERQLTTSQAETVRFTIDLLDGFTP